MDLGGGHRLGRASDRVGPGSRQHDTVICRETALTGVGDTDGVSFSLLSRILRSVLLVGKQELEHSGKCARVQVPVCASSGSDPDEVYETIRSSGLVLEAPSARQHTFRKANSTGRADLLSVSR